MRGVGCFWGEGKGKERERERRETYIGLGESIEFGPGAEN